MGVITCRNERQEPIYYALHFIKTKNVFRIGLVYFYS